MFVLRLFSRGLLKKKIGRWEVQKMLKLHEDVLFVQKSMFLIKIIYK